MASPFRVFTGYPYRRDALTFPILRHRANREQEQVNAVSSPLQPSQSSPSKLRRFAVSFAPLGVWIGNGQASFARGWRKEMRFLRGLFVVGAVLAVGPAV